MWPGSPSGAPARTAMSAAESARKYLPFIMAPRSIQEKFACDSDTARPSPRTPSCTRSRSATVDSTRVSTSSWCRIASAPAAWASALTLNGWRTASTAARKFEEPIA